MEMATPRGKSGRANETILSSQAFKEKEEKEMMLRYFMGPGGER